MNLRSPTRDGSGKEVMQESAELDEALIREHAAGDQTRDDMECGDQMNGASALVRVLEMSRFAAAGGFIGGVFARLD